MLLCHCKFYHNVYPSSSDSLNYLGISNSAQTLPITQPVTVTLGPSVVNMHFFSLIPYQEILLARMFYVNGTTHSNVPWTIARNTQRLSHA